MRRVRTPADVFVISGVIVLACIFLTASIDFYINHGWVELYAKLQSVLYEIQNINADNDSLNPILARLPRLELYLIILWIVNRISIILILLTPLWAYLTWKREGMDRYEEKSVVPEYSPPDDLPAYLMGAILSENVDTIDLVSVITNFVIEGYISISEFYSVNEFTGLKTKEFEFNILKSTKDKSTTERLIVGYFFSGGTQVRTNDLAAKKFYTNTDFLKDQIYMDLVHSGFFVEEPNKVRKRYYIDGISLICFSIIVLTAINLLINHISGLRIYWVWSFQLFLIIAGGFMIFMAPRMPLRTRKGWEMKRRIEGFKMYLHHAGRYEVKKFKDGGFLNYLSYAIVFDIIKNWDKSFKGVFIKDKYKTWYFDNDEEISSLVDATNVLVDTKDDENTNIE